MIIQVAVEGYDSNFSYFVVSGGKCLVVDPVDVGRLEKVMEEYNLNLEGILITHSHFDHVEGVEALVDKYEVPVYGHGLIKERVEGIDDFSPLADGEKLMIGDSEIEVIHTPGHIDDAVCYLVDGEEVLTGDTLFIEGCGRADFLHSNVEDLWNSLVRLRGLSDEVKVYPGHDYGSMPVSTIGHEKAHNKYLLCASFEEFRSLRIT